MVTGCVLWNDPGEFNVQTNDPVEQMIKKLIAQLREKYPEVHWGYLESCGVNTLTNCFAVTLRGREIIRKLSATLGTYTQQFPHLLMGYLNDPKNYPAMERARRESGAPPVDPDKVQGNRVPQFYVALAWEMLGVEAHFEWGCTPNKVREILSQQHPVQFCYKDPGHYASLKAWHHTDKVFYSDDSWPRSGVPGFNTPVKESDFSNIQDWLIWYNIK
jgi:hypothetical protein